MFLGSGLYHTIEERIVEDVIQGVQVHLIVPSIRSVVRREIGIGIRIECDVHIRAIHRKETISLIEAQIVHARIGIEHSECLLECFMSDLSALLDEGGLGDEWIVRLEVVEVAEFLVEGIALHVEHRLHRLCERQFPSPAEVTPRRHDEPYGLLLEVVQIGDEDVSVAFLEPCHVLPVQQFNIMR